MCSLPRERSRAHVSDDRWVMILSQNVTHHSRTLHGEHAHIMVLLRHRGVRACWWTGTSQQKATSATPYKLARTNTRARGLHETTQLTQQPLLPLLPPPSPPPIVERKRLCSSNAEVRRPPIGCAERRGVVFAVSLLLQAPPGKL